MEDLPVGVLPALILILIPLLTIVFVAEVWVAIQMVLALLAGKYLLAYGWGLIVFTLMAVGKAIGQMTRQ